MWRPPTTHHPPHLLPSPLKPLFTVAQGDRRHGNIPLQFIPAPITWETSKSQTKTELKKILKQEKGESATAFPVGVFNLDGSESLKLLLFLHWVQMMSTGQSCCYWSYLVPLSVLSSSNLFPPSCHQLPFVILSYPLTNGTVLDGELVPVRSAVCQQVLQPRQFSLQDPVLLLEGHDWGHGSGCSGTQARVKAKKKGSKHTFWGADCGNSQLSVRFFVTISRTRAGRHVGGASGEGPRTVSLFSSSDKTLSSNLWCAKTQTFGALTLRRLKKENAKQKKGARQTKWKDSYNKPRDEDEDDEAWKKRPVQVTICMKQNTVTYSQQPCLSHHTHHYSTFNKHGWVDGRGPGAPHLYHRLQLVGVGVWVFRSAHRCVRRYLKALPGKED